jgi:hypothetical protein
MQFLSRSPATTLPLICHSPTVPNAGRSPTCRLWTADANSHIPCSSPSAYLSGFDPQTVHALSSRYDYAIPARSLRLTEQKQNSSPYLNLLLLQTPTVNTLAVNTAITSQDPDFETSWTVKLVATICWRRGSDANLIQRRLPDIQICAIYRDKWHQLFITHSQ